MPQDGAAAQASLLALLHNSGETWIDAYTLELTSMIDEIISAHQAGVPIHLYCDHTQSTTPTEVPDIQRLVDAGVDVVIGTSTTGTKYIAHTKGLCTAAGECWEGSVNFTTPGFLQVNTAMQFNSSLWCEQFKEQHATLVAFAISHEPQYQIKPTATASQPAVNPSPVLDIPASSSALPGEI